MNLHYVTFGIVRRYTPPSVLFGLMKLRGNGNAAENDPDASWAFRQHNLAQYGIDVRGKHVLECGSGRYARLALQMLAAGAARITLVDPFASVLDIPMHRNMLAEDCRRLGLDYDDVIKRINVIQTDLAASPTPHDDEKVDLVLSSSVLEHVRDPEEIFRCAWHWLKPSGVTHHLIDLRDHNLRFRYPFEMLTYSEQTWERWLDRKDGFHLNRWRAPDYLKALEQSGFTSVRYEAVSCDTIGACSIRPRLDARFRDVDDTTLAILHMSVYGKRP